MSTAAERKFINLRKRLDQLGYKQPLGIESLPLVEKLFSHLVHTTESLRNVKLNACKDDKENKNFDQVIEPYKAENARLVRENNDLHLELLKIKEQSDRHIKDDYILRIDLLDFEGQKRYADYKSFRVGDEKSAYQISCGEYSGTAGDSLTGGFNPEVQWWANHNGMKFSTRDQDNDNYEQNCAEEDKGGWWYNRFHSTNLNGIYYKGPYTSKTDDGIIWYTWHGWWYSLKYVAMKIRSVNFEPNLV